MHAADADMILLSFVVHLKWANIYKRKNTNIYASISNARTHSCISS